MKLRTLTDNKGMANVGAVVLTIASIVVGIIFLFVLLGQGILINQDTFDELDDAGYNATADTLEGIQDDVIDKTDQIIGVVLAVVVISILAGLLLYFKFK